MICVETPAHIASEQTADYGSGPEPRDVFREILPDAFGESPDPYEMFAYDVLLSKYRYRGIPHCDIAYWEDCMKDRADLLRSAWEQKLSAWESFRAMASQGADFSNYSSESESDSDFSDHPDISDNGDPYVSTKNRGTSKMRSSSGLLAERMASWIVSVPDLAAEFAKEFRDLFFLGV